jgi:peptidoglycan-associated lipoprotein
MKLVPLAAACIALGLAACSSGSGEDASAAGRGGTAPAFGTAGDASRGGVSQSPLGGTARPGSQEELATTVGDRVLFATDAYRIGPDQLPILQRQAEWMNRYRQVQVTVEGHADERGTREYNLALGQRRANSARDVLVSNGVAPARIQTISFGKDRPVQLGSSEAAWAQNRRAVTVVR